MNPGERQVKPGWLNWAPPMAVHPNRGWVLRRVPCGSAGWDPKPFPAPWAAAASAGCVVGWGCTLREEKGGQRVPRLLPRAAPAVFSAEDIHSAVRGVVFLDVALVLYGVFQRGFSLCLLFSWEENWGKKKTQVT